MFYEFNHLGSPDYAKIENGVNFNFPMHLHQCFEVIIAVAGEMQVTVDKTVSTLKKGEALLIFPNQIHSLKSKESEHLLCIFSPSLVSAFSSKVTDKLPVDNKFAIDDYLVNALSSLDYQSKISERKGILYLICSQFEKNAKYSDRPSSKQDLLYNIFSFVELNYNKECSLYDLAKRIGYDYSYLSRYFRKTVGISFNSYVNFSRLSRACYLMENTDMSIIQCAYESGYVSLRSFNRNFKNYYKITPVEYRNSLKS